MSLVSRTKEVMTGLFEATEEFASDLITFIESEDPDQDPPMTTTKSIVLFDGEGKNKHTDHLNIRSDGTTTLMKKDATNPVWGQRGPDTF